MNVNYKAYIYSKNRMLDNQPVWLKVGVPVTGKFRSVQELCNNSTESEKKWYSSQVLPNIVKEK